MLKVYSKTVCPACMVLKNELKKAEIPFEEVNIDKDPEGKEILVNAGIMGVPVVDFNGELLVKPNPFGLIEELTAGV